MMCMIMIMMEVNDKQKIGKGSTTSPCAGYFFSSAKFC